MFREGMRVLDDFIVVDKDGQYIDRTIDSHRYGEDDQLQRILFRYERDGAPLQGDFTIQAFEHGIHRPASLAGFRSPTGTFTAGSMYTAQVFPKPGAVDFARSLILSHRKVGVIGVDDLPLRIQQRDMLGSVLCRPL